MKFYCLYDPRDSRNVSERISFIEEAIKKKGLKYSFVDVSKPSNEWPNPKRGDIVHAITRGCYFAEPLLIRPGISSIYNSGIPFLGYDSDTTVFSAHFEQLNIPSPKTVYVEGEPPTKAYVLENFGLPVVFKATGSSSGNGTILVETEQQLQGVIDFLSNSQKRYLIREYIPNDGIWRIAVVDGSSYDPVLKRNRVGDFRSTGEFDYFDRGECPAIIRNAAIEASSALNVSVGGADIAMHRETSTPFVIEYNLRFNFACNEPLVANAIVNHLIAKVEQII